MLGMLGFQCIKYQGRMAYQILYTSRRFRSYIIPDEQTERVAMALLINVIKYYMFVLCMKN